MIPCLFTVELDSGLATRVAAYWSSRLIPGLSLVSRDVKWYEIVEHYQLFGWIPTWGVCVGVCVQAGSFENSPQIGLPASTAALMHGYPRYVQVAGISRTIISPDEKMKRSESDVAAKAVL